MPTTSLIKDVSIATGIDSAKIGAGDVSNAEHAYLNSVSSNVQTQLATIPPASIATGFIGGLNISNNGSDGDHDIDIAVGSTRDYTDAVTMTQSTAALTKRIDATWAVGDGNGGLDSTDTVGTDTGYGVYLIRRSDTGVVDVLISSDMTAAGSALTMPTNYDQKRLIGWVLTDSSSNILNFTQVGDYFRLTSDMPNWLTDTALTTKTYETVTLPVPPSCVVGVIIQPFNPTSGGADVAGHLRTTGSAQGAEQANAFAGFSVGVIAGDWTAHYVQCLTDANATGGRVDYAMITGDGDETFYIEGVNINLLTRSNP